MPEKTVTLFSGVTAVNKAAFGSGPTDLTATPATETIPVSGAIALAAQAKTAIIDLALSAGDANTLIVASILGRRRTLGTWGDAMEFPVVVLDTSNTAKQIIIPCAKFDALFVKLTTYDDTGETALLAAYANQTDAVLKSRPRRVHLPLAIAKDAAYSPTLDDSTTQPIPACTKEAWLEFAVTGAVAVTGEVWPRYAGSRAYGSAARYSQTNIQSLTDKRWFLRLDDVGAGGFDRIGIKLPTVTSGSVVSVWLILIVQDEG